MKTMADKIPLDAPVLNDRPRSDYPLSGVRTGPAWRAAWSALREWYATSPDHQPVTVLTENVRELVPDANPDTVKNILLAAFRHGVLSKVYVLYNSRNQAAYRISDKWIKAL